ncbi:class I SAM-dependent methyltransferase [Aurantimonas marianensis]|uniref:Class I SAM-dependent methyltransferase n=1 Tax=Aurantimonas marianensis TaxID=2920428 RepID=A0A9X2KE25_9HYPH|nr:class I SAM-dependent methyltransferase [Aurantimonas marianensis]MCP3054983.1 class I SAM-dependent methyltransferase [Aurantimonas marianensis]
MTDNLDAIAHYYAGKLAAHGERAQGVDWNGETSQALRFGQLLKVVDTEAAFSLNDLGCGYGALRDQLSESCPRCDYAGYDIAPEMVAAARNRFAGMPATRFEVAAVPDRIADFTVASGIFNVRLDRTNEAWTRYVETTLEHMDRTSARGFAFNCLTSYSDENRKRPDLYYCDPGTAFDWCRSRYSRNVALLHDYDLYEFTIIVRKSGSGAR